MVDSNSSVPSLVRRPVTVDFIEHRLPKYHPAFVNPPVHYDAMSGEFVPNNQALASTQRYGMTVASSTLMIPPAQANLPPRPAWTDAKAMQFWNGIFPEAMIKFRSTPQPKGRSKTGYDIRDKLDWDSVYDALEEARTKYQQEGGAVGWVRKVRRKVADSIGPAAEASKVASKLTPNDPYATPVLGSVEVILNAIKTAATVRNRALRGFDSIIPIFSDVELFLATFPNDEHIRNSSIDLTVTALEAVERVIGFFIRNELLRAGRAFATGGDYEESLMQSLDRIGEKSKSLMTEAAKSHIHEFHIYSHETQKLSEQILEGQIQSRYEQQEHHDVSMDMLNSIFRLMDEHKKQSEMEAARLSAALSSTQQQLSSATQYLHVMNGMLERSRLSPSPPPPPSNQAQLPARESYVNQDALRRLLNSQDLDLVDAAFTAERRVHLGAQQLVQVEQIVSTALFREWMVSPGSTRLLVQWTVKPPRETVAGISALSAFCTTMTQALRARGTSFLSAVWFAGCRIEAVGPTSYAAEGARAMVASLIDQLLRQHTFDTRYLDQEVDFTTLPDAGLGELTKLLGALLRRIPRTITVVFIIDGVVFLERDEFAEALLVLSGLLRLTDDTNAPASVKVLFTSTPGTDVIRGAFENRIVTGEKGSYYEKKDLILEVGVLPRMAWAQSDERMFRELEG